MSPPHTTIDTIDGVPVLNPTVLHSLATRYTTLLDSYDDAWQECVLACLEVAADGRVPPAHLEYWQWLKFQVTYAVRNRGQTWRSQGLAKMYKGGDRKRWTYNPVQAAKPLAPYRAAMHAQFRQFLFHDLWPSLPDDVQDVVTFVAEESETIDRGLNTEYARARNITYTESTRRISMLRRYARKLRYQKERFHADE